MKSNYATLLTVFVFGLFLTPTKAFSAVILQQDPVVANEEEFVANEDEITNVDVLSNDTGPIDPATLTIVNQPANGMIAIKADNTLDYQGDINFFGEDSFTYRIGDGNGNTDQVIVSIQVNAVNDTPVVDQGLNDQTAIVGQNFSWTIPQNAFSDPDPGSQLSITSSPLPPGLNFEDTVIIGIPMQSGIFEVDIMVEDEGGLMASAPVVFEILESSTVIAMDDELTAVENTPVSFDVLANDAGPIDASTLAISAQPSNGSASINADNTVNYTPNAGFNGMDSFNYEVSNGTATPQKAIVSISVSDVNNAPEVNQAISNEAFIIGKAFGFTIPQNTFIDGDADTLALTASNLPEGLTFDGSTIAGVVQTLDSYDITISATDAAGEVASTSFLLTIQREGAGNIVANEEEFTAMEDMAETVDVVANDTGDIDLSTLAIVNQASNGTAVANNDGTVTYTSDLNYNGEDSYTYQIGDGLGNTARRVVSIQVDAVNDTPVVDQGISNQTATVGQNFSFTIPPNAFSDPDAGSQLSITSSMLPPGLNFEDTVIVGMPIQAGSFEITIMVEDEGGLTASTPFTIDIAPGNMISTVADTANTMENGTVTIDVLANDSGPVDASTVAITSQASNGNVTVNNDGTLDYAPDQGFSGSDSFTYAVGDGEGSTMQAEVSVSVAAVNEAPTVAMGVSNQMATTNQSFSFTLGQNVFSDPDGDELSITVSNLPAGISFDDRQFSGTPTTAATTTITVSAEDPSGESVSTTFDITVEDATNGSGNLVANNEEYTAMEDQPFEFNVLDNDTGDFDATTLSIISNPSNGTTTIGTNGLITYTSNLNYNGQDSYTYEVGDGNGNTVQGTVSVTVSAVNDAPEVNQGIADQTGTSGQSFSYTIPQNAFSDPDVDSELTITTTSLPSGLEFEEGSISGTPATSGTFDVTVTASDEGGLSVEETFSISIEEDMTPANATATADSAELDEDGTVTVDVLANDSDFDASSLIIVNQASNGTATVENGQITYEPNPNFEGSDSFSYSINNGPNATSSEGTVSVTVNNVNDDPVVNEGIEDIQTVVGDDFAFNIPQNAFSDLDGDELTFSATSLPNGLSIEGSQIVGTTDTLGTTEITLTAQDTSGATVSTTFAITIESNSNDQTNTTVANPEEFIASEDVDLTFNVANNDTGDIDLSTLTITNQASNGTVVANGDGTITYTSDANYSGNDSFTYQIGDGNGNNDQASVSVTVANVNDAPTVEGSIPPQEGEVSKSFFYSIPSSLFNDVDVNDNLSFIISDAPTGIILVDGVIQGTPQEEGVNTVTITATDLSGESASTSFEFTVIPDMSNPIIANGDSGTLDEDSSLELDILANDTGDVDPQTLTITVQPSHGTISITDDDTVTYTPNENFFGTDSFNYSLETAAGNLSTAIVDLEVASINDAPETGEAIDNQVGEVDETFSFFIPNNAFTDLEQDASSLTLTYSDLPLGLSSENRQISGIPEEEGTFDIIVTATDNDGLTATNTFQIVVNESTLSLDRFDETALGVYPNPTRSVWNFDLKVEAIEKIIIIDMAGKIVLKTNTSVIDASRLTSGIYVAKISTPSGTYTRQLIKQ